MVSVPRQAGAQHSQSPIKAENGSVMIVNTSAVEKFPQLLLGLSAFGNENALNPLA
jgi:hypothetical protein